MALWRLYYHLVWSTQERLPLIASDVEPLLYGYMIGKASSFGAIVHAVGGVEDHVHLVVSIPPKLSIADFVKGMKGSSAYHINHLETIRSTSTLRWQRGSGVFPLGAKQLEHAISYVQNQKERHRTGKIIPRLEEGIKEDDGPALWNHGAGIAGRRCASPPGNENAG